MFNIHPWSKHAEFGIWIEDKKVWGQGYATEATSVVLKFAFERLNLHKVYLTVDADNLGAIRSYEKSGFKKDGILRDEVYNNGQHVDRIMISILKHEF